MQIQIARPARSELLGAALAGVLFLVSWELVHHWFWARGQLVDTPTYRTYGDAIVHHGQLPYRDFAVEYPPAALPPFVLPSLFGSYDSTFAWLMAVCGLATIAAVARLRLGATVFVALAPLLVGSLIFSRFDLWPVALATGALAALVAGRHPLGWGLLGAAVVAKLWPLVLVPPALSWSWRHGARRAPLAGLAVAAVIVVPFAVLAPAGIWASLERQASRPLQVESLAAALVSTFGRPHVFTGSGSQNTAGHAALGSALAAVGAAAVVGTWIAFARGPAAQERLLRYGAAAVTAFVAFDKVLSPQYLIWLVPLVALVGGRRGLAAVALLTTALVLTQVWFPLRYWGYATHFHLAGVVLARDLVLVALLALLAWPVNSAYSDPTVPTPGGS
jgi:hypothetical protein